MKNEDVLMAAILSAVSGAVIGLLLSSEENSDIKKLVREKSDSYLDRIKRELRDVRRELEDYKDNARREVGNARDRAYSKGEEVLDRAKQLSSEYESWTKEKLNDRAEALDIKGYLSMSRDELINAIKNIR